MELYTKPASVGHDDPRLNDYFLRLIPVEKMPYQGYRVLDQDIMMENLYQSLSAMKVDKVSGPDGLNVEFYHVFWPVIGRIVHASLLYAQTHGSLSDSQRRGILRLIPKKK